MDQTQIIIVSTLGAAWLVILVIALVLCYQVSSLRRQLAELQGTTRVRVQKLTMEEEAKNHAFHNPALAPDEELSKRGYSMYVGGEDVESSRGTERQTGGQFVDELARELESRHQRQTAPPFLLQSIEENKRKTRELSNPVANHNNHQNHHNNQSLHSNQSNHQSHGRQSGTNPNFIY